GDMRVRKDAAILALVGLALMAPAARAAVTVPSGFEVRTLATGLDLPIAIDWAPSGRMFIATKPGVVYYLDPGDVAPHQLLDISSHVNGYADRGLIGMAVDSDFASNHYLWLLYVYEPSGTPNSTDPRTARLTRVTVGDNGTAGGETAVLGTVSTAPCATSDDSSDCIPAATSHVVDTVRSAPDGTLWLSSGDGDNFQVVDPNAFRAYDEHSYAGKVVHVDRSGHGLPGHPFCPPASGGADDLTRRCAKIYAKGFRNPFRFTLGSNGTPIVGDVGWNTREEIDFLSPGGNYGWPCYEAGAGTPYGSHTSGYGDDPACSGTGGIYSLEGTSLAARPPAYDYLHDGQFTSITGGPVFPGGGGYPPEYAGKLFFGDYSRGTVSTYDPQTHDVAPFLSGANVADLEAAPDGNLAYADVAAGVVAEVAYAPNALSPVAVATATPRGGDAPLEVHFDGSGSREPNGGTLTYHWDFGDASSANEESPTHSYSVAATRTAWLTVKNTAGRSASAAVVVAPGDHFPSAHIGSPAGGSSYVDGAGVHVSGSGSDPDSGPDPHLRWRVTLHDGSFSQAIGEWFDTTSFDLQTLTDYDFGSYYEVSLTATDAQGLSDSTSIDIHPQTVPLSLTSSPPGAALTYGERQVAAPFQSIAAVGLHTSVSAPESLDSGGVAWTFDHWSDGGARLHNVVIGSSPVALTATYRRAAAATSATASLPALPGVAAVAVKRRCVAAARRRHHRRAKAATSMCAAKKHRAAHHRRRR
ncbi:MAG: PQQ-dependent sugar dehydrogenase, partial [Thermoleophilaceae bacterium]